MKKYLSAIAILLAVLVVFSSASITSITAGATYAGDANKDTLFDERDVLWTRKALFKESGYTKYNSYADVNNTGDIDADDVRQMRFKLAKVIKEFSDKNKPTTIPTTTTGKTTIPPTTSPEAGRGDRPFYLPDGVDPYYRNALSSMSLLKTDLGTECGYYTVAVNQAGYTTDSAKTVYLMEGRENQPLVSLIQNRTVYLVEETTKTVVATFQSGRKSQFIKAMYGLDYIWYSKVDISEFNTPGTYRIYAPSGYSHAFTIGDTPYSRVNDDVLMGLYYQRCGGALEENVLRKYDKHLSTNYGFTEGEYYEKYKAYLRDACHLVSESKNPGAEVVVVNTYDAATDTFVADKDADGNVIRLPATDFAYGLHDAGDYGRYSQPAAQVVADLLYTYELAPEAFTLDVVQDKNAKGVADTLPDILDHARWEAKFLLNMQDKNPDSSTYGGFYFKICTQTFASAQGALPDEDYAFNGTKSNDHGGFRVMSVNFATTASVTGALASCAYTFKDIDPEFAQECKEAALLGYDFYINNRKEVPRNMTAAEKSARNVAPSGKDNASWQVGGGAYGGSSAEADNSQVYMYGALYRVTGNEGIHTKLKSSSALTSMDSQTHGGYGSLAYILTSKKNDQAVDETHYNKCVTAFTSKASSNVKSTRATAFGNFKDTYGWGSNPRWANELKSNTIATYLGVDAYNNSTTLRSNISYLLGANILGYSFVSGFSEGSSKNIHHYPSNIIKARYKVPCVPGLVAAGYTEETSTGSGWSADSGKFRYRDSDSDHVSNEICVYWNSSITFAYASIVQEDILAAKAS